ncbi:hypothetical protein [Mesomycoplasma dispar]|uniref:hypothetical protein n=1 Tax=Mesomycoplasma dispar TaxID=86660 RepID=UPI001E3C6216|nr:hypothetical protein [Mesomycoplasma dispar]
MKKEQKKLSPFELEAEKIVNKYADYKKLKKEDFHEKAKLSQHLGYEKAIEAKMARIESTSKTGFRAKLRTIIAIIFI